MGNCINYDSIVSNITFADQPAKNNTKLQPVKKTLIIDFAYYNQVERIIKLLQQILSGKYNDQLVLRSVNLTFPGNFSKQ